jgi:hypothetical protein
MLDEFGHLEELASSNAQERWHLRLGAHAAVAVEQFLAEVYSRHLTP